ncbi:MAG: hypothetical protein HPY73_01145 [Methanomassiliicoccales archaeon]|nr:MAG: hypothetical protein HPY73_01145 [Methanomassiliicoccales archaeon]
MRLEPVDRPPVFYQHLGAAKWVLEHTGLKMRDGFHDPDVFSKICLAAHELYGFDNLMAGWGDLLIEAQAHGARWKFPERDFYPRIEKYLDVSMVDGLTPVDPMSDRYWSIPLKAASEMMSKVGRETPVIGCVDSPMLVACETIGMETLLISALTDPGMVHRLVSIVTESCKAYGEAAERIGMDTIFCDNSSAGIELMSKEQCSDLDHRYLKDLMSSWRRRGIATVLHNDSAGPYLDLQCALLPKGLTFQVKSVDLIRTFDLLRGRICAFVGIDHQELLFRGAPVEIEAEVSRVIDSWGNHPGLVIASGCELPYKTPIENISALKNAAIRFGMNKGSPQN